jgi:hypothetical protein
MTRLIAIAAVCLVLGACAAERVDLATFPTGVYGTGQDLDDAVLLDLHRAFNARQPFPTNPRDVARLLAEVEYFAGEINAGGRWSDASATVQTMMLQARAEIRAAIGVTPGTKSQQVVDALLAVAATPDPAAQLAALGNPIFTLGARPTLERLGHMPPLPITREALGRAGSVEDNYN